MFFTDTVGVGSTRRTADGYLVADAKVARTGIQIYTGAELGRPELNTVRLYRPESEVFAADTMHSFAFRPMTVGHPSKMVDATNWKEVSVGQTGGEVVRDGEVVRVPLVLMDAGAISQWEAGKRELSMGYTAEIVFGDGVAPNGDKYDAIQTNLRMNHLALVDKGRAGSEFRIGDRHASNAVASADDHRNKESQMSGTLKVVLVDGLSVETTEAGAQAIHKLQALADASAKSLSDAQAAHAAALAVKDAEIDALKAKVLTDAQMAERVNTRAALVANAQRLHPADYTALSDADVRRTVVIAKVGDAAIAGKPDAYVEARFDILVADAATPSQDAVTRALADASNRTGASAYETFCKSLDYRTRKEG